MRDRFTERVLPHLDDAWRYARTLARDPVVAEDLVQEAFIKAFRSYDTCRGQERGWLLAIVRNCWHDYVRARPRHVDLDSATEPADPRADAEADLARTQEDARLRAAITAMPEPFREVIVLREIEELSYREIAAVTAVPLGTVMSRLARARSMLGVMVVADRQKGAA